MTNMYSLTSNNCKGLLKMTQCVPSLKPEELWQRRFKRPTYKDTLLLKVLGTCVQML